MAAELLHSRLPHPWDYGVTEDGRIFFINDESKSTTWLHPVYNHPIQSGHLSRQDLPKGWELAFTAEGIPYYVDHTNLRTSFIHPVTGESALPVHENRPSADIYNNKNFKRSSLRRSSKKQKVIDKAPEPKRTRDGPVALRGWLYKQDTGGLKSWKKRWFVLSDFCLYYYKDQTESQLQGSILLPSYEIGFCNKSDGVNRKYSFKAEHQNMRTYYFATDNSEDQSSWMTALKLATQLKQHPNEDFKENSFPSSQNPSLTANSQLHDNSHLEDSGGFNESRSPLSTLGDQSPNSRGATMRSSLDDPAWYRDNPQSDPNSLWDKDESRYEADLRMRSRPGMRNMYVTREPAYPDPRPIYDSGSQHQDQSVISQNQNSYRVMDTESMSSYGSHGILQRDHNYNVPKDQYPEPLSRGNVRSSQQDVNTLEQSTDSVERTLDRSFDSVEVLPGYDSFAENHLQSSGQLQHTNESSVLSRNSSIVEVQRQNSLLRLQQWTKRQRDATPGRGISGYGNRNEPPPSDGIRKYGQDNMRKSQGLPGNYAPVSPSQNARPKQPTPMVLSSPDADDQPARPPIPAEYREQYIRELAETKTPHTRNDLLTSIEIQRIKQQQPLVFQYPEVSMSSDPPSNPQYNQQSIHYSHPQAPEGLGDLHLGPQSGQNASTQPKHGPPSQPGLVVTLSSSDPGFNQSVVQHQERFQYEQLQQTENRPNNRELSTEAIMEKRSQNVIDPSKSWDDLNDLDPDSAQFKYNNRIEQLLAEKRRIMGETADMLKTQSSCYPEETLGFIQAISPGEQENTGEVKGHVKTDEAKQARQHVEPTFTGVRYDNIYENMPYLLAAASAPGAENIWPNQKSTHRASPRSPSSAGYARSTHAMPDGRNSNDPQTNNRTWPPSISQSECNTSFREQPSLVGEKLQRTSQPVESRNVENVQQSLGKLHIDVGEWPEGGQFPYRPPDQMASRPLSSQKESLLGRMSPHLGNTITEGHDMVENTGYPDDQQHLVSFSRRDIETIKEDPNMSDQDILTTKTLADLQRHLSGHRLRLSISAGDLIGKSHEELVLLLIQLRRDQSRLERARDYYRAKLDVYRPQEKDYKLKRKNSVGRLHDVVEKEHDQYVELRKIYDELENQLEVSKPLVNLLDNMVRMGSLYGGDNLMLASQYKQHKLRPGEYTPPKKMITFSRQYQEQKLSQLQEAELKQLMDDEVDLEDKLQQLYQLDRELQEKSLAVTNLQENKDLLESTVAQLRKDIQMTSDPRTIQNMKYQLRHLESELVTVRQQLAESSKLLEETSAEDARVENEVMLLRKKIYGLNRTHSTPSLTNDSVRARQQLEQELEGVQNVMNSLSKQGVVLSDTIKALRHSTPDLTASGNVTKDKTTYLETDMDTGRSRDLTKEANLTGHEVKYSKSPYSNVKTDDSYIYASVKKTRRQDGDWETRDRSRSEPPAFDQSNKWRSDRETTNRKTAISPMSGNTPEQALAPRGNLEYMASGYSEDIRRGQGPSSEEGKPLRYDGNQQHNVQSGVFRAEMQVVTPDNNKYYGEDSMDRLHQQQSQLRDYQLQDQDKSTYGQNWSLREQQLGSKPMSEVHPQQQQQSNQQQHQQKHYDQEGQVYFTANDSQIYRPIELSQADENTKKFFGILPKDMARSQTVREVKKEAERRSRERKRFYVNVHGSLDLQQAGAMSEEFQRSRSLPHKTAAPSSLNQSGQSQDDSTLPWRKSVGVYRPKQQVKPERHLSAADRLFPKQSDGTTINPNSRDSVRRMSDIFSPRPFSSSVANQKATQPSLKSFSDIHQGHPVTVATVRPVVNNKEQQGIDEIMGGKRSRSTEDLMKNEVRVQEYRNERLKSRHNTRGRFMTISSTEPIRMESGHAGWKPSKHQTAAGDLISGHWHDVPDCVRSEPLKDFHFDSETIDREVLYVPDKVDIPDRYVPDSDDEETPEDRERRLAKGEQIKRMLAAQSLAEWKQEEVGLRPRSGTLHKQVEAERKRREHILDLKQALAVQVTQRSKQVAERFLEKQNEQLENGTADLKKSELSLALLGEDGCGYVPALAPAVARKLCAEEYLTNTSCEFLTS